MTLIRIGLLYPSIHNSFITNKQIEVKLFFLVEEMSIAGHNPLTMLFG
jgi:hypothetical protein